MKKQIVIITSILTFYSAMGMAAPHEIKSEDLIEKVQLSNVDLAEKTSINNKDFVAGKVKKQNQESKRLSQQIIDNIFSKTRNFKQETVALRGKDEVLEIDVKTNSKKKLISAKNSY